jgi:GTP cyclohydrolase I
MITEETELKQKLNGFSLEDIGDDHLYTGLQTPMKQGAFKLSNEEKKRKNSRLIFRNNGRYGIGSNR